MQFESFSEFFHMGGHGTFIFSVYLITAIVVIGNIVLPLRQKKQFYIEHAARALRAGLGKEPSAGFEEMPSAGLDDMPSAENKESP